MLKFAVLCFLVIMASTFAEQCGDQVCGAGSCCAEYPEMHCKRVGQLYDICVDADATKDSGNHLFFCPCDEGMYCDMNTWSCTKENFWPIRMSFCVAACSKCFAEVGTEGIMAICFSSKHYCCTFF
uniref:U20-Hexatoxin-Hf1ae_1 n=1 Tax=Hadronyche formidabilis TaxID=426499 RepID=A0A4Q8K6E1_HADFO